MTAPTPILDEPLLFERIFLEKVWGGRALEKTPGIALPPQTPIGETWELSDRADQNSVVKIGRFRGTRLRELMNSYRADILGRARASADGSFPLLVKFLDAREHLSVQVHPHRANRGALPKGDEPKTESWYILAAEKGSAIWLGLAPGVDAKTFSAHASGAGVVDLLARHRPSPGQFFFVPGGTVHAIGAGVTLVEIQETSDTTYRLYDWGRTGLDGKPRPVHVEPALRVVGFDRATEPPKTPVLEPSGDSTRRASLVDCAEFAVELLELDADCELDTDGLALVVVVVAGSGRIVRAKGEGGWPLNPGDTWLVPAAMGRHRLVASSTLRVLVARTKA